MKRNFKTNEFYNIYNQGVDKRKVFCDQNDKNRFIHNLYEFNDDSPAIEFSRRYKEKDVGSPSSDGQKSLKQKSNLLNLYAFILMPDYYCLLVQQTKQQGISSFMRKINTGYTKFFNKKNNRQGYLFQGSFKAVHVDDDIRFGFLICYIHSRPLINWKPDWEIKKLTNQDIEKAMKFLEKYQWSSHLEYIGKRKNTSIINKEFLLDFFDGTNSYKEFFIDYLKGYKKNIDYIKDLLI
ncbi:transposase [Patescibacteria group bacterium]|nr:transposase [Patescibacteria group bacterium]